MGKVTQEVTLLYQTVPEEIGTSGTAKMATNLIVKLGLEARANELRTCIDPVHSVRDIARILSEESGQTINFQSVQRYFNKPDVVIQKVQARTEVVTAAVRERLDTLQQLRDINKDTLDILKEAKGDTDKGIRSNPGLALAAIQRIEKQLELQAKLLGDLPSQPSVNIAVIDGQFLAFRNIIMEVTCPDCRARITERLQQVLGA